MAKKVKAKKPVKKVLAKKVVSKKPAKKTTVKKPIKKTAPKAKKVIYKAPAKKIVKKVAAKKQVAKAKKVIKKISKPAPKKIVKKIVSKKIIKKAVVKKAIKKTSKPAPKKIVKKIVSKKIIKKAVKVVSKAKLKVVAKKPTKAIAKKPIKPIKPIAKPTKNKLTAKKSTLINKPAIKSFIKPTISAKPIIEVEKTVSKFQPKPTLEMAKVAMRYSDVDLAEFKEIIIKKVTLAKEELSNLIDQLQNPNANGGNDTDSSYQTLEDGQSTAEKEQVSLLAQRQRKFVENLENALVRIENKTYGICKETGKLIAKERLRAVPHTTLSMEAKLQQYR